MVLLFGEDVEGVTNRDTAEIDVSISVPASKRPEAIKQIDVRISKGSVPSAVQTVSGAPDMSATVAVPIASLQRLPELPPSIAPGGYSGIRQHGLENGDPVEVLPFLVLATPDAVADAVWLQNMGVTALIFCTRARVPSVAPHMDVTQCAFDDAENSLSLQRQKAMDMISSTRQADGRVLLISCDDTKAAVCLMYLMWECRLTLLQAVAFLQCNMALKITPRLCPRPGQSYLLHYEAILHGSKSMRQKNGVIHEI